MLLNCGEDCLESLGQQGDQTSQFWRKSSWIFIGRSDAEAPTLWPPDRKSRLIRKDLNAGKDRRQKEKEVTENEMVRWHQWLNGHEFEQTPEDSGGHGSLSCCSPWGHRESYTTEQLNNNSHMYTYTVSEKYLQTVRRIFVKDFVSYSLFSNLPCLLQDSKMKALESKERGKSSSCNSSESSSSCRDTSGSDRSSSSHPAAAPTAKHTHPPQQQPSKQWKRILQGGKVGEAESAPLSNKDRQVAFEWKTL